MEKIRCCPYCGYSEQITYKDGSITCLKCQRRYEIKLVKKKKSVYEGEEWFPIKGYEEAYEVSNYLRIQRIDHVNMLNRHLASKMLRVYPKNAELYVSLYKDGISKEYNVKKLYRNSVRRKEKHGT